MFRNSGRIVKEWAKVLFTLGVIGSVIYCIVLIMNSKILLSIGVLIGGIFASWITSCVLYAIGQAAEASEKVLEYARIENRAYLAQHSQEQKQQRQPAPPQNQRRFQQK